MNKYVIKSAKRTLKTINEAILFGNINVYIQNSLPTSVDLREILHRVERNLPSFLSNGVESIFVGVFKELQDRELLSMYADGAIYLSSEYTDDSQVIFEAILHEFGHSLEEEYAADIYADQEVLIEFTMKRKVLFQKLASLNVQRPDEDLFMDPEYSLELDKYFYQDVGYDNLQLIASNLFVTPYAVTSIREYFAIGFEEYFAGRDEQVKRISPALYKKLRLLQKMY